MLPPFVPLPNQLPKNSFSRSKECNCSMMLFRHLAKTGGTSVAVYFSQLERKIGWRVSQIGNSMQVDELLFDALVGEYANDPDAFLDKHPYNMVVFHTKTHHYFIENIMPLIRFLRRDLESRGCCFSFSTILREPIAHAVSDYNYEVRNNTYIGAGRAHYDNIIEYTPQDRSSKELLGFPDGPGTTGALSKKPLNASMQEMLWDILEHDYTFVGTTEHFEHTMFFMMRQMGVPLEHLHIPHANDGSLLHHTSLIKLKDVDEDQMKKLEMLHTEDKKVYEWAKSRLEAMIAAMPEEDRQIFEQISQKTTKDWMFGEPTQVDNFMQVYYPYKCDSRYLAKVSPINTPQYRFCVAYTVPVKKFMPPDEQKAWDQGHRRLRSRGYGQIKLKSAFETKDLVPCPEFDRIGHNETDHPLRCRCPINLVRFHPEAFSEMHRGCGHLRWRDQRCKECKFKRVEGERDDYESGGGDDDDDDSNEDDYGGEDGGGGGGGGDDSSDLLSQLSSRDE